MLKQGVIVVTVSVTVLVMASQGLATGSADGVNSNTRVGIGPTVGMGTKSGANTADRENGKGAKVAQMVSIGFMVAGAAAAATCGAPPGPPCPYAPYLFAAGAIAGMVSQSNAKTKKQAGVTGIGTDGWGNGGYDPFDPYGRDDVSKLTPAELDQLKAAQNAMQALTSEKGLNGIKFDSKAGKITGADGKVFKVSDFDSPASMKAAGFSDSVIKGLMDKAAKLEAEALAKVGGVAASGFQDGGGGAPSSLSAGTGVDDGSEKSGGGGGRGGARNPAAGTGVAGLSKDYNGDPIGVAQDELFLMMTRRYKVKEKQDSFFSEAELIKK